MLWWMNDYVYTGFGNDVGVVLVVGLRGVVQEVLHDLQRHDKFIVLGVGIGQYVLGVDLNLVLHVA